MTPILNYEKYISGMEKSMADKMFWVSKIPQCKYSAVVDYGCADGTFLQNIRKCNDQCTLYGIDIDEKMLEQAKEKNISNTYFITEEDIFSEQFEIPTKNSVLNLSSVIHEIYSYKNPQDIQKFWEYAKKHKYICIRDMCIDSDSLSNMYVPKLPYKNEKEKERRTEFENKWGSVGGAKPFVHYMLKYRYIENWKREVKENYLPLDLDNLLSIVLSLGYEIIYIKHFTLPFLKEKIKEDWGYELKVSTHIKLILKKKEYA